MFKSETIIYEFSLLFSPEKLYSSLKIIYIFLRTHIKTASQISDIVPTCWRLQSFNLFPSIHLYLELFRLFSIHKLSVSYKIITHNAQ
jgi:hypothetical protein